MKAHWILSVSFTVVCWLHLKPRAEFNGICLIVAFALLGFTSMLHALYYAFRNLVVGQSLALAKIVKNEGTVELVVRPPRPWKVRAGQYVYLRAPGVRRWSFAESHPFSIIWWEEGPDGKAVSISVLVRPESGFTQALMATRHTQLRVLIDGPYGACKNITSYDAAIMFASDIGIAAQLPYVKSLLNYQLQQLDMNGGTSRLTRRISLIWELQEESKSILSYI